ncbi:hypothetical protein SAMN06264364_11532 [Quadrisphaera granulorum]|uniref:Uncharacterized protein n=1 Tax=Quadrisphaera granulorum TaxID=317664 RepID=A0A316A5Q2_9ACTN|nr:hypothetical protein [Quadrisphaera granulorum]PWJ53015.1 hypothetical protein BXY45_11532 [Quadrisphaera granulorum]SZE97180.1 hypothetical protein SAMN06264364_11532 [Quadrisphaera granulorum]
MEQQLLALVAVPGRPVDLASMAGPRHLFRAVAFIQRDGDPQPQVGIDSDGDLQCRWAADGLELVVTVEERGAGYVWALDSAGDELMYAEWKPTEQPHGLWDSAGQLLRTPQELADAC